MRGPVSSLLADPALPRRGIARAELLAAYVAGLFAVNLWLHFPGTLNNDSIGQLKQAISGHYGDWHPPVMAWLWSLLLPLGQGPAPMLVLQLGLYWLGIGLLADGLRQRGQPALAWAVATSGAFPPFLYLNAVISKDAGLVGAWLAAVGLLFWFRSRGRRLPPLAVAAVVLLLAYGTLVRTNAIFGIGALALYAAQRRHPRAAPLLAASVLGALLALPLSQWVNTHVFHARQQHAVQSLFLYDLLGIAAHTGDPGVLAPRATLSPEALQRCYTPYWWDSLSPWGACADLVKRPPGEDYITEPQGLMQQWLGAIATHPVAYAAHRLAHFNSELLFLVPRKHIRFTPEYAQGVPGWKPIGQVSAREIRWDPIRKNPASWPAVWLVWGGFLALWLARLPGQQTGTAPLALALSVSALAYSGAYLLVGVATDMRYHYWSLLALLLATVLVAPALAQAWRRREPLVLGGAAAVMLVAGLGMLARLTDWRGLF